MARHIMAVCVVCLLCADRLPCQDHFSNDLNKLTQLNAKVYSSSRNGIDFESNEHLPTTLKSNNAAAIKIPAPYGLHDDAEWSSSSSSSKNGRSNKVSHHRQKRHAGHAHNEKHSMPDITEHFLQRLISRNEQQEDATQMSVTGFQHLLEQLNFTKLIGSNNNGTCVAETKLVQHVQPHDLSHHEHDHSQHQHKSAANCTSNDTSAACTPTNSEDADGDDVDSLHKDYKLSAKDLLNLCPVLLYQLASPSTAERLGCIDPAELALIDNEEMVDAKAKSQDNLYVWIYSFISVFACGILGLVGVAIIPFMDSRYYKHIIQYLVSLAVGTMTGDALLHLLPHALAEQNERNMIYKGLTCMGGIIFFYITEHGLTMISEWRKRIEKKETKKPSRAKVVRDPDSSMNNSVAGDKMCKQKYSSYPYCYDEIAMDHKKDVWMHLPNDANASESGTSVRNGKAEHDGTSESAAAAQSLLSTSHNHYAEMNHHRQQQQSNHHDQLQVTPHQHLQRAHSHDSNNIATDLDGNAVGDGPATVANGGHACAKDNASAGEKNDTVTVILREHESSHHGHSHRHGHVHSPPESLSAVAWMIIMGDGLHNFTDGMAIGAAFADNIAGGFSTSLAVFCHELPHELGDFAILLKAGMSVKSAVYYNLLTGVLSFIGMIFGIVFSQTKEAAQWMFAAAAGLFIYIALVDMMPEISAAHKSLTQFALQILGILSGVFIMLLIAIYEGDLITVFESSTVH